MASNQENRENRGDRYQNKSRRINAWSDFIRSMSRFLWLIVVIIALVALGKIFIFKSDKSNKSMQPVKKPVVEKVDWSKVNKALQQTMMSARLETEKLAAQKLDTWIAGNMKRVDSNFLDWYFSYWTQQELGLKGLLAQVFHWVDSDNPSAAEKITQQVQEEFTNRVIRPPIAQLEIERIIGEIVNHYSATLKDELKKIPSEYNINPADWERYISDISIMVKNVEANRSTPLTLKAIVGLAAGGTVLMVSSLKPIITKISSKISARLASKTAAKMATKTGSKVAARTGGKFFGAIVAVGVIIWDVWDHYATKKKAKPVLRENIFDYLKEVKMSILHDPEYGIMTIIFQMENTISHDIKVNESE